MKPETVMSAKLAMPTSSAQVADTSSRKVYFFKKLSAVLSMTTDSGGTNNIKDTYNQFV